MTKTTLFFFLLQMVSEETLQAISEYTGVYPVVDTAYLPVREPSPLYSIYFLLSFYLLYQLTLVAHWLQWSVAGQRNIFYK